MRTQDIYVLEPVRDWKRIYFIPQVVLEFFFAHYLFPLPLSSDKNFQSSHRKNVIEAYLSPQGIYWVKKKLRNSQVGSTPISLSQVLKCFLQDLIFASISCSVSSVKDPFSNTFCPCSDVSLSFSRFRSSWRKYVPLLASQQVPIIALFMIGTCAHQWTNFVGQEVALLCFIRSKPRAIPLELGV